MNEKNNIVFGSSLKWKKIIPAILLMPHLSLDADSKPIVNENYNIILILVDDMGYSDIGCYGGEKITPNIDRLAESGMRFTEFYVSPICSPSRASLMTGCYPQRVGISTVVSFNTPSGINPREYILPEMMKDKAYQTALFGKWHLGGHPVFHPQKHGFHEFYGTIGSNDVGYNMDLDYRRYGQPGLYLLNGTDTVAVNPPQWKFTRQFTEKSVDFILKNREKPFFLFLSHNMPHTPIFVSNEFAGKSKIDLYHDVIMEIDWSVGKIMKTLTDNGLTEKTLVVFMSDNGPWLKFGNHGGSAYPLSGGKKQTLEGGVRVPAIMVLPGVVPNSSECDEMTSIMDLYPTIASLTNSVMTKDKIDGKNILPLMKNEKGAKSPYSEYYYYFMDALQAVRAGDYKLQLPHPDTGSPDPYNIGYDGLRGQKLTVNRPLALFNLKEDPSEQVDISALEPEIVQKLLKIAENARKKLGDSLNGMQGEELRLPGNTISK
jgi:arylsulfatase A